jgi:hypothetical protein
MSMRKSGVMAAETIGTDGPIVAGLAGSGESPADAKKNMLGTGEARCIFIPPVQEETLQ